MTNSYDENVIAEFESGWTGGKDSLQRFIRGCDPVASSDLQFGLLRREIRLRLRAGANPAQFGYEEYLPHFIQDVETAIISEAASIAQEESPIEKEFGQLPRVVGGYEVVEQVGRDWISVCYDAHQVSLSRTVRFRVMLFPSEELIAKARTIASLEHPGFESVIEVLKIKSLHVIVSQVEDGESVADLIRRRPETVTARQVARWVADSANSLLELHRHDVEHLNISPCTLVTRFNGGSVLMEPKFVCPLGNISSSEVEGFVGHLSFPYRSICENLENSQTRRRNDVVALGLVLFVLLTKTSLESFYLSAPLPGESQRLKTLVMSHLDYATEIDPVLKSLCLRSTLGVMEAVDPCELLELRNALRDWLKQDDLRMKNSLIEHDSHSNSESFASSIARKFTWFSKQ